MYQKGKLVPGNAPQPTYYHAEDVACIRMQKKSVQKDDIYCGNFYFACLTPAHVKVLKQHGYWEHIKANRSTEKEHYCTKKKTLDINFEKFMTLDLSLHNVNSLALTLL